MSLALPAVLLDFHVLWGPTSFPLSTVSSSKEHPDQMNTANWEVFVLRAIKTIGVDHHEPH